MVLHLLGVPAAADAELEAAAREQIEARDLLGGRDRVPLDDEADAGADPEALRGRRGRHERHERIEGVRVLLRQLAAAGEGGAPAHRNMGVLGDEERLEAARLGLAGQLVDADRVVGGEDADADVHGVLLGVVVWAAVAGSLAANGVKVQCSPDAISCYS